MKDLSVSIILPVYNQASHIGKVVEEYEATLSGLQNPHELILVTNGCRDNSFEICQALADRFAPVRVINSEMGGWGLAVKLGIKEAKGDLICYTNSARTSPQDLSLMVVYALIYPDVIIKANRKIRDNWFRRLGSLLYNLECRALFDISNWDINGTPKVFPKSFDKLLHLSRNDDLIDAEFNIISRNANYPMLEVPVFSTHRHGGSSTTNIRSALKMYWGAYQLFRSRRTNN